AAAAANAKATALTNGIMRKPGSLPVAGSSLQLRARVLMRLPSKGVLKPACSQSPASRLEPGQPADKSAALPSPYWTKLAPVECKVFSRGPCAAGGRLQQPVSHDDQG